MGARFQSTFEAKSSQLPGPGAFDPKPIFKYEGHTKFGSGLREGIYNEKLAKLNPSPLAY